MRPPVAEYSEVLNCTSFSNKLPSSSGMKFLCSTSMAPMQQTAPCGISSRSFVHFEESLFCLEVASDRLYPLFLGVSESMSYLHLLEEVHFGHTSLSTTCMRTCDLTEHLKMLHMQPGYWTLVQEGLLMLEIQ